MVVCAGDQALTFSWCGNHVATPELQLSQHLVSGEISVHVRDWIILGSALDWSESGSESLDIGTGILRFRFCVRLVLRVSGIPDQKYIVMLKEPNDGLGFSGMIERNYRKERERGAPGT